MMNARAILGLIVGLLLIASSGAHAFLGWPPLREALERSQVDADVIGALAVGWYFGSVAMLAFGLIVTRGALRELRKRASDLVPACIVALAYVGFGLSAYIGRGFNPHFLFFVSVGILLAVHAVRPAA